MIDFANMTAASDHMLALLTVAADPQKAMQFLEELRAIVAEGGKRAAAEEIARHHAELAERERLLVERKDQLDRHSADLSDREQAVHRVEKLEAELAMKLTKLKALAA